MCLAIPGVVIDIDEKRMGTIDMMGVQRSVSFDCPGGVHGAQQ